MAVPHTDLKTQLRFWLPSMLKLGCPVARGGPLCNFLGNSNFHLLTHRPYYVWWKYIDSLTIINVEFTTEMSVERISPEPLHKKVVEQKCLSVCMCSYHCLNAL